MEIEKKKDLLKSQNLSIYTEQCDLLKMISIPTFGIYSNDYAFLEQILILKSQKKMKKLKLMMICLHK